MALVTNFFLGANSGDGFQNLFSQITDLEDTYDLMVLCEARTLKELAQFVHSRLSVIEGVTGTSTHFMLKTYKYGGMIFEGGADDRRQAVMP